MNGLFPWFAGRRLGELAEHTPASRDRYVDFLRAFSIAVVVFGHWLSVIVFWDGGRLKVQNAVGIIPGLWITTWVLQVMPLFFFVGGFSNLVTLNATMRRGEPISTFYRARAIRLLKPTGVFIAVWFLVMALLFFVSRGRTQFIRGSIMLFAPLWFIFVYQMVVIVTPLMKKLHQRYRIWVVAILVALTVLMDVLHFWQEIPAISWANVAFVWLLVHQLGFFYADGTLVRAPRWLHLTMALGGLTGLVILTNIGVYPKSMVGTGFEKTSNMNPPTVCIVLLTFWLVGVAMLLRHPINRWLSRRRPWIAVIAANNTIMTFYLWHQTAYAITYFLLSPIGLGHSTVGSLSWWLERPIWIAGPAIILFLLVGLFGRFERPASPLIKKGAGQ